MPVRSGATPEPGNPKMLADFRYAIRTLTKAPGFTFIVILTLALGIGANTAIFSIVNTALLRALPYPQPEQLVQIEESDSTDGRMPVSYPNFLDWHAQQDVFSELAFCHGAEGKLKTTHGTSIVSVQHVSADFFDVLKVQPSMGRAMEATDDVEGAERVAWITHDAWQRLFDGDPDLVGKSFLFDGQALTIAGILPTGFRFQYRVDVFTAIAPFARGFFLDMRSSHSNASAIARLKPGTTIEAARAGMATIAERLAKAYPDANKGISIIVISLREKLAGDTHTELYLLLGAVGLVLLIACVNVANMLLARSFAREREMAIRTSLGASRWHLLRQLLVESVVLAVAGGAVGTLLGSWGYDLAARLVPNQVQRVINSGGFDTRMLLFVIGITLLTGIAFGLAPAWQLSQVRPIDALKQTVREVHTRFGKFRLSDLLVVAQVALALMLLIGAGLMIRSLERLLNVDTGFEPERVLTLRVNAPPAEQFKTDPGSFTRHFQRSLEPVEQLPEVESAAMVSSLAFTGGTNYITFYRGDLPVPDAGELPHASVHTVTPDYFRTMGIPLLQGRVFDGTEPVTELPPGVEITPENLGVIFDGVTLSGVISQKMADRFWPDENPIGKRFRLGMPNMGLPWVEVAGVVGNTVQTGLADGEATEFYLSLRQWPVPTNMYLVVRSRLQPTAIINAVRSTVESVVRDDPVRDIRVLSERIENSTSGRRFNRDLFVSFAATALILAIIGLYGVLAFNVGRRTREVGIRMALGANRSLVIRSVVARGLTLVVPGLITGLAAAWAAGRVLQSQLFEVTASDPLTYVVGAIVMLLTALAAALVPARRAAHVDPLEALRSE